MIWSIVLSVIGVLGIYLAGRKSKWGWGLGLSAQILWVIFAVTTGQYGFILSALAYGTVYGRNLYKWHKEDSPAPNKKSSKPPIVLPSGGAGLDFSKGLVINGEYRTGRSTLETCVDDDLGNDGLTDFERKMYADRYKAGPGRGLTDKNRETLDRMRERRNDESKRDQP